MNNYDFIVVGCGLSGLVLAERFSSHLNKKILIIDKRDHIGGNCYDYIDDKTQIRMNKYGAHLFHTNDEEVFEKIDGVLEVVSGYSGGSKKNPTYKEVVYGNTGHFEVIEINYDSNIVKYEKLLEYFIRFRSLCRLVYWAKIRVWMDKC